MSLKFLLFGSLRRQKRRARDVDLVVRLENGESVDQAMVAVAAIGTRVRKPIELWLSSSESEPNQAGNYDHVSNRWAFWRRPGLPGFFSGLEPVTLGEVVRLANAVGPHGPIRRGGSPHAAGPECTIRRSGDGWHFVLEGESAGPFEGPLEAAAAATTAAGARSDLGPAQVLWFHLG